MIKLLGQEYHCTATDVRCFSPTNVISKYHRTGIPAVNHVIEKLSLSSDQEYFKIDILYSTTFLTPHLYFCRYLWQNNYNSKICL